MIDNRPSLLLIDDEPAFCEVFTRFMTDRYIVNCEHTGEKGISRFRLEKPDVVLLDLELGASPNGMEVLQQLRAEDEMAVIIILTHTNSIDTAIEATRAGANYYCTKSDDLDGLHFRIMKERNQKAAECLTEQLSTKISNADGPFIAVAQRSCSVVESIDRLAASETTVLITGETGTGKGAAALEIHRRSPRRNRRFVPVNCGGISDDLVASDLFGHEKGAFTGAYRQKPGAFELAAGGTLFLDEIGEASPRLQRQLLDVLESWQFVRVGGSRQIAADVRIIAASNRDLAKAVESGLFRKDLWYRLDVGRLHLPPLRKRIEDIPLLTEHLLRGLAKPKGIEKPSTLSAGAMKLLTDYPWPGNVRELRNVLERARLESEGDSITQAHLSFESDSFEDEEVLSYHDGKEVALRIFQRQYFMRILRRVKGSVAKAAAICGLQEPSLHKILHSAGIDPREFRGG